MWVRGRPRQRRKGRSFTCSSRLLLGSLVCSRHVLLHTLCSLLCASLSLSISFLILSPLGRQGVPTVRGDVYLVYVLLLRTERTEHPASLSVRCEVRAVELNSIPPSLQHCSVKHKCMCLVSSPAGQTCGTFMCYTAGTWSTKVSRGEEETNNEDSLSAYIRTCIYFPA